MFLAKFDLLNFMKNEIPNARSENIIVQELTDEILVCDTTNNRMLCLNKTAAEVWKMADGTRNIKEISRLLSRKFKSNVTEDMISFALVELSKKNLLIERMPLSVAFQNLSRREVIRRVGLASMVALPLISTLTMPTATRALSAAVPCQGDEECNGGCCDQINSICLPPGSSGCFCFDDRDCASGCCDIDNNICTDDTAICSCAARPGRPGCPCTLDSTCDSGCCTGDVESPGVCAGGC